jgi:dTDP-4-amino-4,6-dideoxygalactose transaminase
MRPDFLPYSPPMIGQEEIDEVVDTLRSGWITTGPKTRQFEEEFSRYVDAPSALALNSCTAGLHAALVALGIGPGDEVITTCMTFAASVNVIEHVGATPVLVDVEPDTLNFNPELVERAITPRTKAILAVHFAGHPVDLDAIKKIARERNLFLVEDAAHAIGAKYRDCWIGSGDNPTAFSFYATKNMTTGEGGMLTGDCELISRARMISLHGMSREAWSRYQKGGNWRYEILMPGFKYNMTDIQAALGLCQLRRLAGFQRRREEIAEQYTRAFSELPELELPTTRSEVLHAWHLYVLRVRGGASTIGRDHVVESLANRNIGTSVHFIPIHTHPYYRDKYGYRPMDFPIAFTNFDRMLSIPLNPSMTEQDVADVIEAVSDTIKQSRTCARAA